MCLPHQARLPDAWLSDHADDLPVTGRRPLERQRQRSQLGVTPDETSEPARLHHALKAAPGRAYTGQLEGVGRLAVGARVPRADLNVPLRQSSGLGAQERSAAIRTLLQPHG